MAYAPLIAGQDYLGAYGPTGLDAARKGQAEAVADLWVDQHFQDWDRATWSTAAIPADVKRAALMVGSADYILRSFSASNPDTAEPAFVSALRQQAEAIASDSKARGWVLGADRCKQHSKDGENAGFRSVRCIR